MKKRILIDILIILILGLLPALWLRDGSVILGHDAGLALDPQGHFLDRIFVWSQRFSIGTDQNGALLGAFFIHSFEAFLAWIGLDLHMGQVIQFIFWFTMPGLAMYFFASKIFSDKKYLPLIASVIYMLNYYLLQGWFIAERTKFSIYIAFPLVLYFLIMYLRGRMRFLPSVVLTGVVLGIFNGGGSLPLYGGLLMTIIIIYVYINAIYFNFDTLKRTIFYSLGASIFYFLLNAYWVIPYFFYVSGFYSRDLAQAGGAQGVLEWAKYLSSGSNFINIFRGQGIPDWYLNAYHSYSQHFLTNPILILVSFLFPILAFASLMLVKNKKDAFYLYLFVLICLVGILFSSGPQSQFGFIYEAMVRYVPGFAMFRSAFFKFNYMVWFSYGLLIGYALDILLSKIELNYFKKHAFLFSKISLIVIIFGYVFYHYPVLTGSFLDYSREPGKELTTRVKVPEYIFDFGKWIDKQDPDRRYLVLPELSDSTYIAHDWGYWSLAPLNSLLTRSSFVQNTALVSQEQKLLLKEMYSALRNQDLESFEDFVDVFAIDAIVIEKDYDWKNSTWGTINPQIYEDIIKSHPELFTHEKTFDKWIVYSLNNRKRSLRVNSSTKLTFLAGKLEKIVSFPYFDPKTPLFLSDVEQKNQDYYAKNASDIFLSPECIQCDMEYKGGSFTYYNPKLLPGSPLYPFVTYQEKKVKASSNNFMSLLNYDITTANRRIIEVKWMIDSRNRIKNLLVTLERYKETIHELKQQVSQAVWDESATQENIQAQMVMNHILGQIGIIDEIYKSGALGYYERLSLEQSYNDLLEIEKVVTKKLWYTQNMDSKKYIYDLSVTGDYGVYIKKGSLTNPTNDPSGTTVTFRDSNLILKPTGIVGDWISFGTVNASNKKLYLSLNDGTMVNFVNTISPTFPDGAQGITQNKNSFSLSDDSLGKCFYYQFKDLPYLNTQYVVTFKYKNFSDKTSLSFFHQAEGDELLKYSIKDYALSPVSSWTTYSKLITPKDANTRLYFCNGFLSLKEMEHRSKQESTDPLDDQPLIQIKDISFYQVAYPDIILHKQQKVIADVDTVESFKKIDPVTYEINLKDNRQVASLIMRESFGKYWRVCDENNKCLSFDDKSHFANAGFANAWYIEGGLGKKLTLSYYSQRWYTIGTIITVLSAIIIVGGICIYLLRKK